MRVEASKVLAQTVKNRNPIGDGDEGVAVSYGRNAKIEEIKLAAVEFASEFLLDFDLPSPPTLRLGASRGFEDTEKTLAELHGVVHVNTDVRTNGGHIIRFALAIPVYKGQLQKPSIVVYHDKKRVFSQELLDSIIQSVDTNRPKVTKPLDYGMSFQRMETLERPLYSAPDDPMGWNDLTLTERY
jgi:hypothetical protein